MLINAPPQIIGQANRVALSIEKGVRAPAENTGLCLGWVDESAVID